MIFMSSFRTCILFYLLRTHIVPIFDIISPAVKSNVAVSEIVESELLVNNKILTQV